MPKQIVQLRLAKLFGILTTSSLTTNGNSTLQGIFGICLQARDRRNGTRGARATRIGNLRKWCKEKPIGERHDGAGKTYQVKF
jgi:hypothetical protein